MQLLLATALSIVSFASAAPCTSAEFNSINEAYATTLTAACASSLKMNTSTTISTAMGDPYGLCQPACATDLNSLSSGIALCDGTAPEVANVAQFRQMCTDLANPTMNGGTCTTSDMILHGSIMKSPVWTNCSSAAGATMMLIAVSAPSIETLCGSATCTAFLSSMEKQVPNCVREGDTPTNSMNLKAEFQMTYGCTPAAAGAPCTMFDVRVGMKATKMPVWVNCSTFLKLPQGTTIDKVMPDENATATSLPAGFCNSTCPQYLLSVVKSLPSCTSDGKSVSDPSVIYKLCPNAKSEDKSGPAATPPVWANCSSFLNLPDGATIDKVLPMENATAASLPAGFCTSTCPQYLLSVMKSLPSFTMDGKNISDPTLLYTLCPNVKPENKSGASTHHVYLWGYVVVLVTAVAALF